MKFDFKDINWALVAVLFVAVVGAIYLTSQMMVYKNEASGDELKAELKLPGKES